MGERVARMEGWQRLHEQTCEQRLADIHGSIKDVAGRLDKLVYALVMFLVGIAGWMAVQLYVLQPMRVQVLASPPGAVSVTRHP